MDEPPEKDGMRYPIAPARGAVVACLAGAVVWVAIIWLIVR